MTRRMLINAQKLEELRIAVISGNTLENYQVEVADKTLARGNVYRGRIAGIQPSLNAAFIDYGAERNGFLAIQDVVPQAYYRQPKGRAKIEEVLERGRSIIVQVSKEAEGQKGAVLTTNLSLAGRYLVFTPFDDTLGVSRKVEDDETRRQLRELASKLEVPEGSGVIVRTNALDQTKVDLNRDMSALLRLWKTISTEAREGKGIRLIYSDQDLILRALRDYLDRGISEILIDDDAAFAKAQEYLRAFMPRGRVSLLRYAERTPLFSRYDLEPQIDRIYERVVELPSGGSIVIDRTEALTAIDVNSGKGSRGGSQEETALTTNLEAAREVARQLRLRDIGGLVVVDFIDMRSGKNQRKVEKELREEMKADKARSTSSRISANGLVEINRQKIQQALSLRTHRACPTCGGTGRIASPEMVGLNLLRRIEARAAGGMLRAVRVALHPELADAFQNQRRRQITALEEEFELRVEVIASSSLHRSEQEIDWFERDTPLPLPLPAPSQEEVPPVANAAMLALASPEPASAKAAEAEGETPKRPRRRRRSRGARVTSSAAAAAPAEPAPEPEPAHHEGGTEGDGGESNGEPGRRPRRRRRRGRRKNGAEGATTPAAAG